VNKLSLSLFAGVVASSAIAAYQPSANAASFTAQDAVSAGCVGVNSCTVNGFFSLETSTTRNALLPVITQDRYPFFNTFDFAQDEIDWAFLEVSRQVSNVTDLSRHTRITLTAADEFPLLVFWTLKGKDFYCLEPWSAPRNAMNTGDRLLSIEPGATLNTTVSLSIEFS
jgi:galactose mutarotase-like enzyme